MKKNRKFLILLLALAMMCLYLTGCDELDTMKQSHGHWVTEGDTSSFNLNDETYVLLEDAANLNPMYNSQHEDIIYITDPDVPVLLSTSYSNAFEISENGNFVVGSLPYNYKAEYKDSTFLFSPIITVSESMDGEAVTYCKESIYDDVKKKIKDGIEYTHYGYSYFTYDEKTASDTYHYYYLSDDECDAINKVVKTVEPKQSSNEPYHEMYMLSLDKITEDKMFGEVSYDIYRSELGDYSIEHYSYVTEEYTSYIVPEKYNDIFDKIVERAETQYDVYNEVIIYE